LVFSNARGNVRADASKIVCQISAVLSGPKEKSPLPRVEEFLGSLQIFRIFTEIFQNRSFSPTEKHPPSTAIVLEVVFHPSP
jgi:hypothetical protein